MSENENPLGDAIDTAIRLARQSESQPRRTVLSDTLVKSPQWKKNTLQNIEAERSTQAIADLEAKNERLTANHQDELKALRLELVEIQGAYDQFQQQSDQMLEELDQQNVRLRAECNSKNRRSIL